MKIIKDPVPKKLLFEAYKNINFTNGLSRSVMIKYYMELALAVGFNEGIQHNVQHSTKSVCAWNESDYKEFESIREASRKMKVMHSNIIRSIKKRYKCKGYQWDYVKQEVVV
jgi:capsule polysaccharide modification protein KpsS